MQEEPRDEPIIIEPAVESPQPEPVPAAPVAPQERISVIDALRGAALFGILAANIRGFAGPAAVYFDPDRFWTAPHDIWTQFILQFLIIGKFITIFAVLFGIGFAIQIERAMARGASISAYLRRLAWLLVFGLAHSFLLWWGDILFPYALAGFLLTLFRNLNQRKIFNWALSLYLFPACAFFSGYIAKRAGATMPESKPPTAEAIAKVVNAYSSGSWLEILRVRASEWVQQVAPIPFYLPMILGLFLFGVYLWRAGLLRDVEANLAWWRSARAWGLAIGLPANIITAYLSWRYHPRPDDFSLPMLAEIVVQSPGLPALSLFYASSVVLAFRTPTGRAILQPFSYVGRMALTNYLLQSLICGFLFYSYGFRLFGKVGPLALLIPTVIIYGSQVPFSYWWLQNHPYGPMEWLWRRLTYSRVPDSAAATAA